MRETAFTPDVIVIGFGASGALLCTELFRRADRALDVTCIEPRSRLGAGLAYGQAREEHLLNVPAARMSALADQPHHFVDWLRRRRLIDTLPETCFAHRRDYADYLTDCLGAHLRSSRHHHNLHHEPHRAISLKSAHGGWLVGLDNGAMLWGQQVVLALGNLDNPMVPEGLKTVAGEPAYRHNPWDLPPPEISPRHAVAIIGAGLTAVDQIQTLWALGHQGPIHVLSRHGRWPSMHVGYQATAAAPLHSRTLSGMVRDLRRRIAQARTASVDWRYVMDGLRPHTAAAWAALTEVEKRRFMRHLKSVWHHARHRIPRPVAEQLRQRSAAGHLLLHRAPALSATLSDGAFRIVPQPGSEPIRAKWIINCTGTTTRITDSLQPLLVQSLADGLIQPGPAGLGMANDPDGAVIGANGLPWKGLYTIGPMRQGTLWESTAIPEIRQQAGILAARLVDAVQVVDEPR